MLCKFCGGTSPDNANFCGNCGKTLREIHLPYKPRAGRRGIKTVIILLFFLTLATYLSYLIFEIDSFQDEKMAGLLKEKIESLAKESSKGKTIDFYLVLAPEEIDGYLNEELFKKKNTGFRSIHTRLLDGEIELNLSADFLNIPTVFRVRIKPEGSGEELRLSISRMGLGSLPIPSQLYPFLYQRYPWLNSDYLLALIGIKFKEIRVENGLISFKGVWSL